MNTSNVCCRGWTPAAVVMEDGNLQVVALSRCGMDTSSMRCRSCAPLGDVRRIDSYGEHVEDRLLLSTRSAIWSKCTRGRTDMHKGSARVLDEELVAVLKEELGELDEELGEQLDEELGLHQRGQGLRRCV
eukprot:1680811-Pyramimonas_sp.AAC.1